MMMMMLSILILIAMQMTPSGKHVYIALFSFCEQIGVSFAPRGVKNLYSVIRASGNDFSFGRFR